MKKTLTIFGIFISSISLCFAQEADYDLGSYVNPDFKRKALDLDFGSTGDFSSTTSSKSNSIAGALGLTFNSRNNSQKKQISTYGIISGNASSESNNMRKKKDAYTAFNFNREAFHFFKGKQFFEVSPKADLRYEYGSIREKNQFSDYNYGKSNAFFTDINLKLGIGTGRIENVTDARQAMYIVQDLQKKNLLKRTLTNEEVNALAEQITLIKNQRYYDYRIHLADEISRVDSFLVVNDLVEKTNDALYFTSVYDKWMYGDRDRREAGSYIKGGIAPSYLFNEYISNNDDPSFLYKSRYHGVVSYWGGALYADYRYEKPLSLALQSSFEANLSGGIYKYRDTDKDSYKTNLTLKYKLGYYVNTRTYISGSISESFSWDKLAESDARWVSNTLNSNTALLIKGYYYLSPQLRLFGECTFSYSYLHDTDTKEVWKDKYPATKYQLGLSYAIF